MLESEIYMKNHEQIIYTEIFLYNINGVTSDTNPVNIADVYKPINVFKTKYKPKYWQLFNIVVL